eukprot:9835265-Prorocentrum_lima.AAC.1
MDEVIVIDQVKVNAAKVNAVKCKEKNWIEPSCGGADPVEPSSTLQWGVPGEVVEVEAKISITPNDAVPDESDTL